MLLYLTRTSVHSSSPLSGVRMCVCVSHKIAADIARAMMFLHNLTPRVINGRLTSSNVLVRFHSTLFSTAK